MSARCSKADRADGQGGSDRSKTNSAVEKQPQHTFALPELGRVAAAPSDQAKAAAYATLSGRPGEIVAYYVEPLARREHRPGWNEQAFREALKSHIRRWLPPGCYVITWDPEGAAPTRETISLTPPRPRGLSTPFTLSTPLCGNPERGRRAEAAGRTEARADAGGDGSVGRRPEIKLAR